MMNYMYRIRFNYYPVMHILSRHQREQLVDQLFSHRTQLQTRFIQNSLFYDNKMRKFSTLVQNQGSLYEKTAKALETVDGRSLPTEYAPGYKSCRIFDNPNIVETVHRETPLGKIYRYLDITGALTKFNSRKMHLLRSRPLTRSYMTYLTENERKMGLVMEWVLCFLVLLCIVQVIWETREHHDRPYVIAGKGYEFTGAGPVELRWHGSFPLQYPKGRCKECEFFEFECKKRCFDALIKQGHTFIMGDPYQIPRRKLLPTPYPPCE
ncbi:hypothetical protein BEWA_009060 [Theileria equi strain WA]|uniref:Uncharacterized protein n=1 Tax=Theileria equi strain WA TaxID=1537102 RepID=L0B313_THEEQ|nr:hypothetical protein BEWA_009060 [Theileria equi strain WA]AFZ81494.1 hypothetical protein BEWA_009060 [Theileria equi strain WA]|eukprot:XP_004831160.1 hypothetical protein BEWA_009060 [Theileria equi strain WA]